MRIWKSAGIFGAYFLQTNSSEIITLLITILASLIPIPFTIKELIKNYNKANEVKLSKKKLQEDLSKIDISKEKLEELSKILEDVYNTSDTITENFSTVSINHTYTSSKKFSLDELYENVLFTLRGEYAVYVDCGNVYFLGGLKNQRDFLL